MPYAYISNLSINFVGSRREMSLPSPFGPSTLNTIIPDAYIVNITLTGLNEETRNFIYTSVANKINVSQVPLPVQVTKSPDNIAPAVNSPKPPPYLVKNNPNPTIKDITNPGAAYGDKTRPFSSPVLNNNGLVIRRPGEL